MGFVAIDGDGLKYIGQVGFKPGKGRLLDSKCVLKTREQYGVVDGIKGGRKIEKCEQGYFFSVGCKEEVVEGEGRRTDAVPATVNGPLSQRSTALSVLCCTVLQAGQHGKTQVPRRIAQHIALYCVVL